MNQDVGRSEDSFGLSLQSGLHLRHTRLVPGFAQKAAGVRSSHQHLHEGVLFVRISVIKVKRAVGP